MVNDICWLIALLAVCAVSLWRDQVHKKEREGLIDRLMARDYSEYARAQNARVIMAKLPDGWVSPPTLTDEVMAEMEKERKSKIVATEVENEITL